MLKKTIIWPILTLSMSVLVLSLYSDTVLSETLPVVGSSLPAFKLITPSLEKERAYLGIENVEVFSIDQVKCKVLMLELVGVYCPRCHVQLPRNKKLFYRIIKDAKISDKIKILAIAIGATPAEVAYLKKQFRTPYPIVTDSKFEIHKLLGEPRTPFTMLVTGGSNVAYAHLGTLENMDEFFLEIKKLILMTP